MRFWVVAMTGLSLFGCAARQINPENSELAELAYQQRSQALSAVTRWDLSGKLSLDDGSEGGSGRLNWQVSPDLDQLDFRGALGKGAWRLVIAANEVVLYKADGTSSRATGLDELVMEEAGWDIPVDSLKWWVLGMAAPGPSDLLNLDEQGHVLAMQQYGWKIVFDRYKSFGKHELPAKLEARQGDRRVKLAVLGWVAQTQDE